MVHEKKTNANKLFLMNSKITTIEHTAIIIIIVKRFNGENLRVVVKYKCNAVCNVFLLRKRCVKYFKTRRNLGSYSQY